MTSPHDLPIQPQGAIVISEHIRGLALVRSLGRHGIPVWTVVADDDLSASSSRYTQKSFTWPAGDDAEQVQFLVDLAARYQLDGWTIFATSDESTRLCARHAAELGRWYRLAVPGWDVVRWAYDKRLTYQLAAGIGLDQPTTYFPRDRRDLARVDCAFPVVLKPAFKKRVNRFTHDKAWRVNDREALAARYDEAASLVGPDVVMVQELIPGGGDTQFSFGALCQNGRTIACVTARRTRQYPVDFGHSSSFVETVDEPAVEQPARRLLAAMRYTGLAEVEFKRDDRDGRWKLLEVNPRAWTWHALCRRAGVDLPYLLWQSIHGEHVPELRGRSGAKWVRMGTDLAAAITYLLQGRLSLSEYMRSLSGPIELATFAVDDPVPSLLGLPRYLSSAYGRWMGAANAGGGNHIDSPTFVSEKTG